MLVSSRRYKLEIKLKALEYPDIGTALGKLDTLVEKGLMSPFVIGGGVACNWWAEACTTEDLDLFIIGYPPSNKVLEELGVEFKEGERWKLAGVPIDIVLVYKDEPLQQEAYNTAVVQNIDGYKERVILPEYLIAKYFEIAKKYGEPRGKDLAKLVNLFRDVQIDMSKLIDILNRYDLKDTFNTLNTLWKFTRSYGDYGHDGSDIGIKKANYHKESANRIGSEKIEQLNRLYYIHQYMKEAKRKNTLRGLA